MPWMLSQDQFNKFYTLLLTVLVTAIMVYSLISGKTVDWQLYIGLLITIGNHIGHILTSSSISLAQIKSSNGNGGTNNHG